ncbi:sodium:solute symporter family protein [Flavobacterium cellulosilyticum]|uniref:Sodium:solute symporter family protein n=1 Tax=Flavobacterium cellulosilyticum TaxID=2541731 RepID=A0A4V2YZ70_9FLAO|nr:sodium:solute symporter family protein [Flavobacterium cellulosilyticum]TDD95937.1 sodium:solute symporter family protein [Flavobacterium cellulosilyticum]
MHIIDYLIFVVYMLAMLGVGLYFFKKNKNAEDFYVSGRNMSSWHIGLSVVATDVGGGFSIGLGGLGFTMGISGSWMLFTGLLGAWLSAVYLIPKVSALGHTYKFFTFPQIFNYFYDGRVALLAGIISAIGYIGFTSSQVLAGAKLASATIEGLNIQTALIVMGAIAVIYTAIGGLKAVIYTDTIQWLILICGLVFIGIPIAYTAVGGYDVIKATLAPEYLSLTNVKWYQILNWSITIIPIWFVGMTLYQRIYASKGEKEVKKAWLIAGIFEWPIMAFMGVILGMLAKVAAINGLFDGITNAASMDSEMGLPILLATVLPVGLMGLMLSSYFSAILSTADSCLMAASGNIVTDIIAKFSKKELSHKKELQLSQIVTLLIGVFAIVLASQMQNVLELMLYSYAFMVSGLFIPVLGALFWKKSHPIAAFWSMLFGGGTTILLIITKNKLPLGIKLPEHLDANLYGMSISLLLFVTLSIYHYNKKERQNGIQTN